MLLATTHHAGSVLALPAAGAGIATAAALTLVVVALGAWLLRRTPRTLAIGLVALAVLTMAAKCALTTVVRSQPSFEGKQAEYLSRDIWDRACTQGPQVLLEDPGFSTLAVVSAPFFYAFGSWDDIPPAVNNAAVVLAALALAAACARSVGPRAALVAFVLTAWNPSAVYWTIYGLRDPLIYLACALGASAVIDSAGTWPAAVRRGALGVAGACCLMVCLRPEVAVVPVLALGLAAFMVPFSQPVRRTMVVVGVLAVAAAVPIVMAELSLQTLSMDQLEGFTEARLARNLEAQNETLFFESVQDISAQPGWQRLGTQCVGMVLCPLPLTPRNTMDMLVLAESAAWVVMLAAPWLLAPASSRVRERRVARALALAALLGLLAYAPFVLNAGNAFRLRFSMLPFALGAVTLAVAARRTATRSDYSEGACPA